MNSKLLKNGETNMTLGLDDGDYIENVERSLREFSFVRSLKIKKKFFNF